MFHIELDYLTSYNTLGVTKITLGVIRITFGVSEFTFGVSEFLSEHCALLVERHSDGSTNS